MISVDNCTLVTLSVRKRCNHIHSPNAKINIPPISWRILVNMIGWKVIVLLSHQGECRTVELTRPRGSANSKLINLHAKHAIGNVNKKLGSPAQSEWIYLNSRAKIAARKTQ